MCHEDSFPLSFSASGSFASLIREPWATSHAPTHLLILGPPAHDIRPTLTASLGKWIAPPPPLPSCESCGSVAIPRLAVQLPFSVQASTGSAPESPDCSHTIPRCIARYLIGTLYTTGLRCVRVRSIGMMLPMSARTSCQEARLLVHRQTTFLTRPLDTLCRPLRKWSPSMRVSYMSPIGCFNCGP